MSSIFFASFHIFCGMSNGLSVPFPTEDEGFDLIIVRLGQLALTNASTTQIDCRSPPVPGAPGNQWILPRAKKCPPDTFYLALGEAALSNPSSSSLPIKKTTQMGGLFYWQRMRDSNPRKRSQSPVCYRYTNPLCLADNTVIIRNNSKKSSTFFKINKKFLERAFSPSLKAFFDSYLWLQHHKALLAHMQRICLHSHRAH